MAIIVTGGAGFIGSNFILDFLTKHDEKVINLDTLTYAGNVDNLVSLKGNTKHIFIKGNIADSELVSELLSAHKVRAVINFAAESHVDRSIEKPAEFIQTNIVGTFHLLEAVRYYCEGLTAIAKKQFRFIHVSTDEVYGSLAEEDAAFTEMHRYEPNSPYSASKAASDHLVRAYYQTYGLPTITTNCTNNFGPYQLPEKLIPKVIYSALMGKPLTIYGDGKQIRDWLYVKDHCAAIDCLLDQGNIGETYNIGARNEKMNIEIIHLLCNFLDELKPREDGRSYKEQIIFVQDRIGHDRRYAINPSKIERELNWKPMQNFEDGLRATLWWYLENYNWMISSVNNANKIVGAAS